MTNSTSAAAASPRDGRRERHWTLALVGIILLAVIGAVVNVESTEVYVNLRVAPDDFVSSCNISETINCDEVEKSEWAAVMGVPTALWAVVAYLAIIALAVAGLVLRQRRRERGILLLLGTFAVGFGLFLVYLMAFEIGAWCTLCLATDAVNIGIVALALTACRLDGCHPIEAIRGDVRWILGRPTALVGHLALGGLAVWGGFAAASTWVHPPIAAAQAAEAALEQEVAATTAQAAPASEAHVEAHEAAHNPGAAAHAKPWAGEAVPAGGCDHASDCECGGEAGEAKAKPAPAAIVQAETEDGHPWIGAAEPTLVIDEYTDYECPHCRSAHMRMRRLLTQYPGQVRVVHRHFPLDGACNPLLKGRAFHPRACELSRVAVCAKAQGRFWEMNDMLFQRQKEIRAGKTSAEDLARRLELDLDAFQCCMTEATTEAEVAADVKAGMAHELTGTPAFVIDGKAYLGRLPAEALAPLEQASGAASQN